MHLLSFLRQLGRVLWDIASLLFCYCVGALAALGGIAVADSFFPPNLPAIRPVQVAKFATWPTRTRADLLPLDKDGRWRAMQGALRILDQCCPEISTWVRSRWESGRLIFEAQDKGRYAAFNMCFRVLIVNLRALEESDVELACTLAHEFRHSRQPILPCFQAEIARLAGMDRILELAESEAYEFESRVRHALKEAK